jgi:hypothetical protein
LDDRVRTELTVDSGQTRDPLWRGMVCLSIAITFREDRTRIGLPAALDRLRDALKRNDLWVAGDDELLAQALTDKLWPEALAEGICSSRKTTDPLVALRRQCGETILADRFRYMVQVLRTG